MSNMNKFGNENNHREQKEVKMKAQSNSLTIYSVVIIGDLGCGGVSTTSFRKFEDAVDYCLWEIGSNDDGIREELWENFFFKDDDTMYYIEEANLF